MPDLLDQLRDQRAAARTAADEILTRAAAEQRDLATDELAAYQAQVAAEREAADAMEAERDRQLAEVRAAVARRPTGQAVTEPVLTREQSVYDWLQTRGAFDRYPEEPLSLQRYLRAWRPASGTAPPTSGRSPRRPLALVAPWDQLMLGIRTGFTLRFLGERFLADTLSYSFVAYLRADVQLAQPTAFVVDTGVRA